MIRKVTKLIEEFQIEEKPLEALKRPNLNVLRAVVQSIDTAGHVRAMRCCMSLISYVVGRPSSLRMG
jgi:hypothetical protein